MAQSADEFFAQFEQGQPTGFQKAAKQHVQSKEAEQFFNQFPQSEERTGWGAVGEDMWEGVKKGVRNVPSLLKHAGTSFINPHDRGLTDPFGMEDLRRRKEGTATPQELDPLQSPKIAAAALATGTRNIGNIPGNIADYANKRQLTENPLSAYRLPEGARNANFYEMFGAEPETSSQQFMAGALEQAPGMVATGGAFKGIPAIAGSAIGANRNPIEDLVTAYLTHRLGKTIKEAPQTIKNTPQLGKNAWEFLKPDDIMMDEHWQGALRNAQEQMQAGQLEHRQAEQAAAKTYADTLERLTRQQEAAQAGHEGTQLQYNQATGQLEQAQRNTAENFADRVQQLLAQEQGLVGQLSEQTPLAERAAGSELRAAQQEAYNEFKQQFNNEYKDFYEENNVPIQETIFLGDLENDYPAAIEHLSQKTKTSLQDLFSPDRLLPASLEDVVELRRELTSSKFNQIRDSRNQNLEQSKKDAALEASGEIQEIENQIDGIIQRNLPPEQYSRLKDIDKRYGEFVKPFYSEPLLYETINQYGDMPPSNFHAAFNKLGPHVNTLLNTLSKRPRWQKAVAANDLKGMDWSNPANAEKVLQGDFGKILPQEFIRAINELQHTQAQKDLYDAANKQIKIGDLKAIITEPHMRQALQSAPEILNQLDNLRTMEEGLKSLEWELQASGETAAQAKAHVNELKNIWSKISSGDEIKNIINDPAISRIFKQHPELESKIKELRTQQEALKDLEEYLEDTGMSAKEAKEKADKVRTKMKYIGGTAATLTLGNEIRKMLSIFIGGF